jgi:hypothetical protein
LDIFVLTGISAGGYNTPVSCSAAQLGGFLQSISLVRDGTGAYLGGVEVDGSMLISSSLPGGAGEATVKTTIAAATGEVSAVDVAGLTMSVADTTSRWVTGTKVTMDAKPAVAVNAFLKFDSNGIVTGYQSVDPGYVNMGLGLSKTLTFPATFASGETPDSELPEGTTIRTRVNAVNPEGSSQSAYSNSIKPGTTRLLAMGETELQDEQFAKQAMAFTTYEAREADYQAAAAANDLQRKKDQAENLVLEVAQIKKDLAPKPTTKTRKKKS